ncbi:MAG: alkaline phosphatase family protein [Gammaproteobacteria bacterium]|nr:alkaline phosphatase family protein [Gammaproteobacteria bacterium]
MVRPLRVINIVGLTPALLGEHTPQLLRLVDEGFLAQLEGVFPALTCTAQASMLTGTYPEHHGIVANGWYSREHAEVLFWKQANQLVAGEKVWERARAIVPGFSCAQLFWWFNMYASVDYSVTLRPIYPADGRKIPALYSNPPDLYKSYQSRLGAFPMFNFWGPQADIRSSQWIADCARLEFDDHRPGLQLVYLPHLDYNLQRLGPDDPAIWQDVAQIDRVAGELIDQATQGGADVLVVSEYGIEPASGVVNINQHLRRHGLLQVRETLGWELLDAGASRAFAVADHQVAHVYLREQHDISRVADLLGALPGVAQVLNTRDQSKWRIAHQRSGDLVVVAEPGYWFTYYYWLEEERAPDFARTVDIHRKPGYDPVELFIDPDIRLPKVRLALKLLRKQLGFRTLMDVIPLKPQLVKGTHGRPAASPQLGPLLIGSRRDLARDRYLMVEVKDLILRHFV